MSRNRITAGERTGIVALAVILCSAAIVLGLRHTDGNNPAQGIPVRIPVTCDSTVKAIPPVTGDSAAIHKPVRRKKPQKANYRKEKRGPSRSPRDEVI